MAEASYAAAANKAKSKRYIYYLDVRNDFNPYQIPSIEMITMALRSVFNEDTGLLVFPMPRENRGIFEVSLTTNIVDFSKHPVQFMRGSESVKLFLSGLQGTAMAKKKREGLLVTIAQSAIGMAANIPNQAFNKALEKIGELIIPTKLQTYRGSTTLNGNRYVVINPRGEIPVTISVENPNTNTIQHFYTRYKGQPWFCRTCEENHTAPCTFLQDFYRLRDEKQETQKTMIMSDSTLRRAQHVGLSADVECMSGGTIGQIAGALRHNPKTKDKKNVVWSE